MTIKNPGRGVEDWLEQPCCWFRDSGAETEGRAGVVTAGGSRDEDVKYFSGSNQMDRIREKPIRGWCE